MLVLKQWHRNKSGNQPPKRLEKNLAMAFIMPDNGFWEPD